MKPYISVIVPAYNEERFLIPLVDSLFQQDFNKSLFEIILVDNNSTDATYSVAKRCQKLFKEVKITIVKETKQGICFARNAGAKVANGEIFLFLDADNTVDPHLLATIYHKTKKEHYQAGTIRTLAMEGSLRGIFVNLSMEFMKMYFGRPFGKNFCSRKVFEAIGGYDTGHDKEIWYLGTNLHFVCRVKKYLQQKNISLVHIKKPVYSSVRRFQSKGYIPVLSRWGMVYLGIPELCKKILDYNASKHDALENSVSEILRKSIAYFGLPQASTRILRYISYSRD